MSAVFLWAAPRLTVAGGSVPGCSEAELLYALTGGGEVTFSEPCSITLTSPIRIDSDTTIDAGDFEVTLSGGGKTRLFEVAPETSLTLIGLALSGGLSTNGGALYISPDATVFLEDCTFSGNAAKGSNGVPGDDGSGSEFGSGGNGRSGSPGQPGLGGAIYNLGVLVIDRSRFLTNSATGGHGGAGGDGGDGAWNAGSGGSGAAGSRAAGGAIYSLGSLSIQESVFSHNNATGGDGGEGGAAGEGSFPGLTGSGGAGGAAAGGAIYCESSLEAFKSTFADNSARGGDGTAGGTLVTGNGASGRDGGNASGGSIYTAAEATLVNCTIYRSDTHGGAGGDGGDAPANAGDGGDGGNSLGGGIYNLGNVDAIYCTIAEGGAYGGTNGVAGTGTFEGEAGRKGRTRGGNVCNFGSRFSLANTIIGPSRTGKNGYGDFVDSGGNLSSDESLGLGVNSLSGKDPRLGTLGNYGGHTPTVNLLSGSPAVNTAMSLPEVVEDQRGFSRPDEVTGMPDMGAFEGRAPEITAEPSSQTRGVFGSATFNVTVEGDPPLRYTWLFQGSSLASGTNNTLTLLNLNTNQAGVYSVIISNAFGAVTSAPAVLNMAFPPLIQQQPTNQTVGLGQNAEFRVSATGSEPLRYQWRFNTTNLVANATNAVLTFTNIQASVAGRYSVIVSNNVGSETSLAATLTILTPPDLTVPTMSSNTFGFGLTTMSNRTYVTEYKNSFNDAAWTAVATNIGTGGTLTILDPLTNSTRFYRVIVR